MSALPLKADIRRRDPWALSAKSRHKSVLRLGIYCESGAPLRSFNRGLNELECHAVSRFRAAHVPARFFWAHRDEASRDVLEQA
jgi:hypothetical protein